MAPRTATVTIEPYVVEGVASPAATRKLFDIDDARAEKINAWLKEAFAEVEGARRPATKKAAPPAARASKAKKRPAKR